ncbi:hypothetical protein ACFXTO_045136 [Malus domestica]
MCVNLHASWQGRLAKIPNLYSHSRKHYQQDCLLKNRRGTALRISRAKLPTGLRAKNQTGTALRISKARLPTGLLSQKSKRHCSLNLKSQTPNKIAFSKIEKAPLSESRELDSQQNYVLKNRRGTTLRISKARFPTGFLSQKLKRHRSPNLKSQIPDMIACSKIKEAPLSELRELDFLG